MLNGETLEIRLELKKSTIGVCPQLYYFVASWRTRPARVKPNMAVMWAICVID